MSTTFEKGYALLIGVNKQENPDQAPPLPATEQDVKKLASVLLDPQKCGYEKEKVEILLGEAATRINILKKLNWLKKSLAKDPDATAIIYFSGHGYRKATEDKYYLIPYDFDLDLPDDTAIEDQLFSKKIDGLNANQLLLLMDSCHAGETEAGLITPEGFSRKAIDVQPFKVDSNPSNAQGQAPAGSLAGTIGQVGGIESAKGIDDPEEQQNNPVGSKPIEPGEGPSDPGQSNSGAPKTRAVLVSSRGSEESYIHQKAGMSVFTYHLIEALNGHGKKNSSDTTVNVLDLVTYVHKMVPKTTAELFPGESQTPNFDFHGEPFPVAQLLGGKGLPEGGAPKVKEIMESISVEVTNNVSEVIGHGNVTVQGNSGNVNINSNAQVTDNQNAITTGDVAAGGAVGQGNQAGLNVSGNGNAIGNDNQVDNNITTTTQNLSLPEQFQQVKAQVDALPQVVGATKEEVKQTVQDIEVELKKEAGANIGKMAFWLEKLKSAAPTILESVADIIENPKNAAADLVRNIAKSFRQPA